MSRVRVYARAQVRRNVMEERDDIVGEVDFRKRNIQNTVCHIQFGTQISAFEWRRGSMKIDFPLSSSYFRFMRSFKNISGPGPQNFARPAEMRICMIISAAIIRSCNLWSSFYNICNQASFAFHMRVTLQNKLQKRRTVILFISFRECVRRDILSTRRVIFYDTFRSIILV